MEAPNAKIVGIVVSLELDHIESFFVEIEHNRLKRDWSDRQEVELVHEVAFLLAAFNQKHNAKKLDEAVQKRLAKLQASLDHWKDVIDQNVSSVKEPPPVISEWNNRRIPFGYVSTSSEGN